MAQEKVPESLPLNLASPFRFAQGRSVFSRDDRVNIVNKNERNVDITLTILYK
jgi:hypothetical protein